MPEQSVKRATLNILPTNMATCYVNMDTCMELLQGNKCSSAVYQPTALHGKTRHLKLFAVPCNSRHKRQDLGKTNCTNCLNCVVRNIVYNCQQINAIYKISICIYIHDIEVSSKLIPN